MLAVKPAPVIEGNTSNWPEELGTSEALETPTEGFGTPKTSEGPLGETIVLETPAEVLVITTGELWSLGTLVVAFWKIGTFTLLEGRAKGTFPTGVVALVVVKA